VLDRPTPGHLAPAAGPGLPDRNSAAQIDSVADPDAVSSSSASLRPAISIREERDDDHVAVRQLHLAAFGDHGPTVANLVDDLRQSLITDTGLSLVAERAGEVIGHAMFTHSLLDAPTRLIPVQVLSPLGVRPDRQRQGVGAALVRDGLAILTERAVPVVFLEGDPRYYRRFGFLAGAEQGFRKPSLRIPDAGFQAITLPAYRPWMTGTLVYSATFWRHDVVGLRG
jgi:putative acetyltransferase